MERGNTSAAQDREQAKTTEAPIGAGTRHRTFDLAAGTSARGCVLIEHALLVAALAALAFIVFPYARVTTDTKQKLELAAKIDAGVNARRAAHFADIVARCLSGGAAITDGQRQVDCVGRQ